MDSYFMKFAAQGQSFLGASGDSGAATAAIPAPDDDPYITLVADPPSYRVIFPGRPACLMLRGQNHGQKQAEKNLR